MRFLALLAATFPIKAQKPQASIWLVKSSPLSNGREQRKRRLLLPMASCYHFLKKCFLFIFIVFEKQIDREMREEDRLFAGSLPGCLQQLGLEQAKARSSELSWSHQMGDRGPGT